MTGLQTGLPPVADWLADFNVPYAATIGQAVTFVVVFAILWFVGRATVLPLVNRVLTRRDVDIHARRPLNKLVNGGILFLAVAVAFGLAGFGSFLQSLATIAAAATLAIGLALQDVIKNFVAGIFIFTDRPFRIGDWIEWEGHAGIVDDISLRVTRVTTFDNELLTVPNSQLTDGVIKNPVAQGRLRLKFVFGIGYDDDIDAATEIILEEAQAQDGIMDEPAPSVRLVELEDSYVGLQSRIWIDDPRRSDFVKIRGEYVQAVKERFDEAGIEIPYPQRDISGGLELSNADGLAEPGK
jgi:small conductance mechanosensitive channel